MRVKKLDIFGFKSFASRQSISFGDGVTGVVGPNGCGKSNVVDALRWVMGEQNARHLRGGNMQDIIFCGSEKKAALGFAEVTLTIENRDQDAPLEYNHYSEIEITRRLYKTGESEYEINRQKARLKDISEFFMGTGVGTKAYSIIEQGRVNEVISAKPQDRRSIIEEAAGITKYKAKKAAAERRIEATRTNLNRIVDIRNEIEKRVNSLLRDKEKLDQVNILKDTIRNLDLHASSHNYLAFVAQLNFIKSYRESLQKNIDEFKKEQAFLEHSFERVLKNYSEKHEQKRIIEDLSVQHKSSHDLLAKDLEYTKQTQIDNQNFIARVEQQLADLEQHKEELERDIAKFNEEYLLAKKHLEKINQEITAKKDSGQQVILDRQNNILKERDIQAKILSAATLATRMQAELNALNSQEASRKTEISRVEAQIDEKKKESAELNNRVMALGHELELGQEREAKLKKELNEKDVELKNQEQLRIQNIKTLNQTLDSLRQAQSRLASLQEIDQKLEWSDSGISDLLSQNLLKGVVADVLNVPSQFTETVEKCLSHLLDTGLIGKKDELKHTTKVLKDKKSCTTSFYVLEDSEVCHSAKPLGLKCITDFLSIKDENFKSIYHKLSRYYFAQDFEQALEHWPAARLSQAFIVTPTGELLSPDGRAIIFGVANNKGVLARKNEQSELEKKLSTLQRDRLKQQNSVDAIKEIIVHLEGDKKSLLEEIRPLSLGIIRLEESLRQKNNEKNRFASELQRLVEHLDSLLKNIENNEQKKQQLQSEWAASLDEHKKLEEMLEEIKDARLGSEEKYDLYQSELKALEIEKAACQEKTSGLKNSVSQSEISKEHVLTQIDLLNAQASEKNEDELKLKEKERQMLKKLELLSKESESCHRQLDELRKICGELSQDKLFQEEKLAFVKKNIDEEMQKIQAQALVINNLENDINNLSDKIWERYSRVLAHEITDFHHVALDHDVAKKEMGDLKRSLEKMGTVNENAANEYSEFKARQDFLNTQVQDLEDALEQLESAIKKINKTTRIRFIEAFNNINKQFTQVFPRLFNGGHAQLVLTDDEDLLPCGVDIIARPPGKNIGSIELMSGGEKALTAISLIMAIFLIKPSPFCLLDEVDAPLDEANVSRFSQLIKEMSALSQFIVITHNRKTMESADQLYGVTMEDAGSSKIVSVHVQQAFESLRITPPPSSKSASSKSTKASQLQFDMSQES